MVGAGANFPGSGGVRLVPIAGVTVNTVGAVYAKNCIAR